MGTALLGFRDSKRAERRSTLYDIDIATLHGSAIYRFGSADAKVRPFAFGGAGIKYFSAPDLETETKLSFGLGGGLSYFVSRGLAIEGRVHLQTDDDER